jgi:hypothetical protein
MAPLLSFVVISLFPHKGYGEDYQNTTVTVSEQQKSPTLIRPVCRFHSSSPGSMLETLRLVRDSGL